MVAYDLSSLTKAKVGGSGLREPRGLGFRV